MKRATIFAGQGAQAVGMGKDLADAYPEVRTMFSKANDIVGYDLAGICFGGPIEELTKSNRAQPAIFVVSAACFEALRMAVPGCKTDAVAGLSLGEWTALYAAGVLSFEDTVRVLAARGSFMQEACEEQAGGMVSVMGLEMGALETICASTGVEIANLNSPEQTVLSGPRQNIVEAEKAAQAAGAKRTVLLNVAGAFHSKLMASAAKKLEAMLAGVPFRAPAIPVISNVTGQPHGQADEIRSAMVRQVTSSVQWVKTVQWCQANGISHYIECGPGKILSGLVKRIDKASTAHSIQDMATLQATVAAVSVV